MASQKNQQQINSTEEEANFNKKNCLNTGSFQEEEFNKSDPLNSSSIELDDNLSPHFQLTYNDEKVDTKDTRKRSFMEAKNSTDEEEKQKTLDLNLHLKPLGLDSEPEKEKILTNQSDISSTSSCMQGEEEVEELSNTKDEVASLVLMGCSRCIMYVMVSEVDPKCPKCNNSDLIDIFRNKSRNF